MTTKRNAPASEITAFIGLGSNVGDREANLREAIARLDQRGVEVSRESSIYETEPVGYVVERDMGRVRTIANGPRIVDIDLLLFGELVAGPLQNDEGEFRAKTRRTSKTQPAGLIVPHPRMHLRRFVMEPLCEIAPEVIHPVIKKPCREILSSLNDPSSVRLYEPKAIKP